MNYDEENIDKKFLLVEAQKNLDTMAEMERELTPPALVKLREQITETKKTINKLMDDVVPGGESLELGMYQFTRSEVPRYGLSDGLSQAYPEACDEIWNGHSMKFTISSESLDKVLKEMVEDEIISQTQVDSIKSQMTVKTDYRRIVKLLRK